MCNRNPDPPDGILDVGEGRMRAAQAKWGRVSEHVGDTQQARSYCVQERYSLPHWRAIQDVEHWVNAFAQPSGGGMRHHRSDRTDYAEVLALGSKQVRYLSSRNLSFGSVTFFGLLASALA